MKKPNSDFLLPNRFCLTKEEMLRVFNRVSDHWDRNEFTMLQNSAYTSIMELTKLSIKLNDIKVLEKIWYSILMFVEEMQVLNTMKNEANDDPMKEKLLELEWIRVENGAAFVEN